MITSLPSGQAVVKIKGNNTHKKLTISNNEPHSASRMEDEKVTTDLDNKSGHNEFDERCVKLSDHMLTDAEYVENVECENTEVARSEVEEIARSEVICPTVSEEESEITILASQESEISHYSSSNEEINDTVELLHNCSEDYVLTEPIVQPVRQRVETIECQISNQASWTLNTLEALDQIFTKYTYFDGKATISGEYRDKFEILDDIDHPLTFEFEIYEPYERPRSEPGPMIPSTLKRRRSIPQFGTRGSSLRRFANYCFPWKEALKARKSKQKLKIL